MITFVSAFMKITDNESNERTIEFYFYQFKRLVETGIKIHLFLPSVMIPMCQKIIGNSSNLFIEIKEFYELDIYKNLNRQSFRLPAERNILKDSENYIILQNSKIYFIKEAIQLNVYGANKFAWIDFGIGHIIKSGKTLENLTKINIGKGFYIPGCNSMRDFEFNSVFWRFCGGFFVGDIESMEELFNLYSNEFIGIIKKSGVLTWEVNILAYFEKNYKWSPRWYLADHNDTLINNILTV